MPKITRQAAAARAAAVLAFGAAARDRVLRAAPAALPSHPADGVRSTDFARYLPAESAGRLGAVVLGPRGREPRADQGRAVVAGAGGG